jgi:hypothetical protein
MIDCIEHMNRDVWGDKVTLATTAHLLGGLGIGLLIDRKLADRYRMAAFGLVAFSVLAHLYALLTRPPQDVESEQPPLTIEGAVLFSSDGITQIGEASPTVTSNG